MVMKNQMGTTLVEVLVALVILGIAGAGFMMAMISVTKSSTTTDEKVMAMSLAESQMEYIRNQEYGWDYELVDIPVGLNIDTPMAFQFDANSDGVIDHRDNYIQKLEVAVWVPDSDSGRDVLVTLEEYRTL